MAETTAPAAALTESPAEANVAVVRLREAFPDLPIRAVSMFGQDWAIVPADAVIDACRLLRDDGRTMFDSLIDVTAVDLLPVSPRWEVVYQFMSLSRNVRFRLKVEVEDGPDPEVPS